MTRDPLNRLLLINLLSGALIGLIFVGGLLAVDAYGLRGLMMRDADGLLAFVLLCGGFIVTAASVVAGSAVMMHKGGAGDDDDDHHGGGRRLEPVKVRVRPRR